MARGCYANVLQLVFTLMLPACLALLLFLVSCSPSFTSLQCHGLCSPMLQQYLLLIDVMATNLFQRYISARQGIKPLSLQPLSLPYPKSMSYLYWTSSPKIINSVTIAI